MHMLCTLVITMSSGANAISKLKKLLESNYVIEKVQPPVMASDAEVNIVMVTLLCPDGKKETIKAYREEAVAMREFMRTHQ
jgi:proline racemase